MSPPDPPTLRDDSNASRPHPASDLHDSSPRVRLDAVTLDDAAHATRYHVGDTLGAGAMGEVRRCRDRRIGREVAMKVVRAEATSTAFIRERFLREARIQGQLEHPCIVPVYEIGIGPDGATFFTMKRVRGVTLEAILEGLQSGDAETRARWSRRKLLAAFSTVCGAVDYAHARGVVHRDLKPGNVMLGDFGEVYVLDWGVARVIDAPDDLVASGDEPERVNAPMPERGRTVEGTIVGTPGYMAPEQVEGVTALDGRADVYALGSILFEVLAFEPLHTGLSVESVLVSTVGATVDARPSSRPRGGDTPPELDALCVRATARDRDARLASARELRDAIERFLDGDRDLERRRALAVEHLVAADRAIERALAGDNEARPEALREVGRALALDPENPHALRSFVGMLVEPPKETPPEVVESLRAEEAEAFVTGARGGARAYFTWFVCLVGTFWLGVRDVPLLAVLATLVAACVVMSWYFGRTRSFNTAAQYALLALNTLAVALMSRLFGPFVLVPAVVTSLTLAFSLTPHRARRFAFGVIGGAGMVAPALLDASGLIEPSYVFHDGAVTLLPRLTSLPPVQTFVGVLLAHVATLYAAVRLRGRIREAFDDASRRLHLLAWQLRQVVPREALATGAAKGDARTGGVCAVMGAQSS
ncbi:MAG: serine/threonine-protein kinase [Polyangiales bacterium]